MSEADRFAISSSVPGATTPTADTRLLNMTANAACVGVCGVTQTTRLPLAKPSESTVARASSGPSSSLCRYRYVMMSDCEMMCEILPCLKSASRCTTLGAPVASPPLRGVSVRSSLAPVARKPVRAQTAGAHGRVSARATHRRQRSALLVPRRRSPTAAMHHVAVTWRQASGETRPRKGLVERRTRAHTRLQSRQ